MTSIYFEFTENGELYKEHSALFMYMAYLGHSGDCVLSSGAADWSTGRAGCPAVHQSGCGSQKGFNTPGRTVKAVSNTLNKRGPLRRRGWCELEQNASGGA